MQDATTPPQGPPGFSAVLHQHRSLAPNGFLILMIAVGVVSFVIGAVFCYLGAWPVLGFFGLDVLLIYVAFKLNYRAARGYEVVELTESELKLTRVSPAGQRQSFAFNPYWVRVLLSERPNGRTFLRLASHGKELEFGRCLNDDERREFAGVLRGALAAARSSPQV